MCESFTAGVKGGNRMTTNRQRIELALKHVHYLEFGYLTKREFDQLISAIKDEKKLDEEFPYEYGDKVKYMSSDEYAERQLRARRQPW